MMNYDQQDAYGIEDENAGLIQGATAGGAATGNADMIMTIMHHHQEGVAGDGH